MQRHQRERSPSEKLLLLRDMEARKYQKSFNASDREGMLCYVFLIYFVKWAFTYQVLLSGSALCDAMCSAFI